MHKLAIAIYSASGSAAKTGFVFATISSNISSYWSFTLNSNWLCIWLAYWWAELGQITSGTYKQSFWMAKGSEIKLFMN